MGKDIANNGGVLRELQREIHNVTRANRGFGLLGISNPVEHENARNVDELRGVSSRAHAQAGLLN